MIALLLLIHVLGGQTLSGIAAQYHTTIAAIMADNPQVRDPNVIKTGEALKIPETPAPGEYRVTCNANVDSAGEATVGDCAIEGNGSVPSTPVPAPQPTPGVSAPGGSSQPPPAGTSGYAPVPVGPPAFWECVERAESSDNPRAINSIPGYIGNGGGLFGDLTSTWNDYGGYPQPFDAPVSVQVAMNAALYESSGMSPWLADGCPQQFGYGGK